MRPSVFGDVLDVLDLAGKQGERFFGVERDGLAVLVGVRDRRNERVARVEIAAEGDAIGGGGVHGLAGGDDDILGLGIGVERAVDGVPTLHEKTGAGQDVIAFGIELESAVTSIISFVAALEDEEGVAAEGDVGIFAGGLSGAVGEDDVDRCDVDAETDLLRVGAAEGCGGFAGAGLRLAEHVGENGAGRFKACGIDVGDVVADRVHACLMNFETGHAGEKGTHHDESTPLDVVLSPLVITLRLSAFDAVDLNLFGAPRGAMWAAEKFLLGRHRRSHP